MQLFVRETRGEGREIWVDEDFVDPNLVASYFKHAGEARLAAAADRRRKRMQERKDRTRQHADEMAALADIWTESTQEELAKLLTVRSAAADLDAVVCNTHKDTESVKA